MECGRRQTGVTEGDLMNYGEREAGEEEGGRFIN
jgi:hypothetical protein